MAKDLVVGLDLSTASTGIVILTKTGKVHKEVCIKSSAKDVYKRIHIMAEGIYKALVRLSARIEMVVIEDVYLIRRNTFSLLELRGAVIEVLLKLKLNFITMATQHARYVTWACKGVIGFDKLDRLAKKAVIKTFMEGITKHTFLNDDTSDASLMAYAYIKELA